MAVSKTKHRLLMLYSGFVRLSTMLLIDEIPFFRKLRGFLYGLAMARAGRNLQVCSSAILWGLEHFELGNDIYVGPGAVIIGFAPVQIGHGVLIGPYAVISTGVHRFVDGAYRAAENIAWPVSIGDGSWIAAHATVGVRIGKGALVTANARVSKAVKDFDIVGSAAAKSLK